MWFGGESGAVMKFGRIGSLIGMTLLASSCVIAAPSAYMPSSSLTTGSVSNNYAMSSLAFNPASAQLLLRGNEKVRFGCGQTVKTEVEIEKSNILFVGRTGTGKTLLAKTY